MPPSALSPPSLLTSPQGRLLHILPAKKPPSKLSMETSAEVQDPDGFRAERQAQKKADAGEGGSLPPAPSFVLMPPPPPLISPPSFVSTHSAWNALFNAASPLSSSSAGNRSAWNSLFMRADTVAEAVAAHYGVTKAELLDR